MKNSEVFFNELLLAGFKPGVNFYKNANGIYLDMDAISYLVNNLHPEMAEELKGKLKLQDFKIKDLPSL